MSRFVPISKPITATKILEQWPSIGLIAPEISDLQVFDISNYRGLRAVRIQDSQYFVINLPDGEIKFSDFENVTNYQVAYLPPLITWSLQPQNVTGYSHDRDSDPQLTARIQVEWPFDKNIEFRPIPILPGTVEVYWYYSNDDGENWIIADPAGGDHWQAYTRVVTRATDFYYTSNITLTNDDYPPQQPRLWKALFNASYTAPNDELIPGVGDPNDIVEVASSSAESDTVTHTTTVYPGKAPELTDRGYSHGTNFDPTTKVLTSRIKRYSWDDSLAFPAGWTGGTTYGGSTTNVLARSGGGFIDYEFFNQPGRDTGSIGSPDREIAGGWEWMAPDDIILSDPPVFNGIWRSISSSVSQDPNWSNNLMLFSSYDGILQDQSPNNLVVVRRPGHEPGFDNDVKLFDKDALNISVNQSLQFGSLSSFDFGSSDFMIDFWIYLKETDTGARQTIMSKSSSATTGWWIYEEGGLLKFESNTTSGIELLVDGGITAEWTYCVLARTGNTWSIKLFTQANSSPYYSSTNTASYTLVNDTSARLQVNGGRDFLVETNGPGLINSLREAYIFSIRIQNNFASVISQLPTEAVSYISSTGLLGQNVYGGGTATGTQLELQDVSLGMNDYHLRYRLTADQNLINPESTLSVTETSDPIRVDVLSETVPSTCEIASGSVFSTIQGGTLTPRFKFTAWPATPSVTWSIEPVTGSTTTADVASAFNVSSGSSTGLGTATGWNSNTTLDFGPISALISNPAEVTQLFDFVLYDPSRSKTIKTVRMTVVYGQVALVHKNTGAYDVANGAQEGQLSDTFKSYNTDPGKSNPKILETGLVYYEYGARNVGLGAPMRSTITQVSNNVDTLTGIEISSQGFNHTATSFPYTLNFTAAGDLNIIDSDNNGIPNYTEIDVAVNFDPVFNENTPGTIGAKAEFNIVTEVQDSGGTWHGAGTETLTVYDQTNFGITSSTTNQILSGSFKSVNYETTETFSGEKAFSQNHISVQAWYESFVYRSHVIEFRWLYRNTGSTGWSSASDWKVYNTWKNSLVGNQGDIKLFGDYKVYLSNTDNTVDKQFMVQYRMRSAPGSSYAWQPNGNALTTLASGTYGVWNSAVIRVNITRNNVEISPGIESHTAYSPVEGSLAVGSGDYGIENPLYSEGLGMDLGIQFKHNFIESGSRVAIRVLNLKDTIREGPQFGPIPSFYKSPKTERIVTIKNSKAYGNTTYVIMGSYGSGNMQTDYGRFNNFRDPIGQYQIEVLSGSQKGLIRGGQIYMKQDEPQYFPVGLSTEHVMSPYDSPVLEGDSFSFSWGARNIPDPDFSGVVDKWYWVALDENGGPLPPGILDMPRGRGPNGHWDEDYHWGPLTLTYNGGYGADAYFTGQITVNTVHRTDSMEDKAVKIAVSDGANWLVELHRPFPRKVSDLVHIVNKDAPKPVDGEVNVIPSNANIREQKLDGGQNTLTWYFTSSGIAAGTMADVKIGKGDDPNWDRNIGAVTVDGVGSLSRVGNYLQGQLKIRDDGNFGPVRMPLVPDATENIDEVIFGYASVPKDRPNPPLKEDAYDFASSTILDNVYDPPITVPTVKSVSGGMVDNWAIQATLYKAGDYRIVSRSSQARNNIDVSGNWITDAGYDPLEWNISISPPSFESIEGLNEVGPYVEYNNKAGTVAGGVYLTAGWFALQYGTALHPPTTGDVGFRVTSTVTLTSKQDASKKATTTVSLRVFSTGKWVIPSNPNNPGGPDKVILK